MTQAISTTLVWIPSFSLRFFLSLSNASEVSHWDQILPAPLFYSQDSTLGFPLDSPTSMQILTILAFAFFSPLPPPTLSHPSRWSQSPGLSSLSHLANSHWLSILHKLMYMFPCYSFYSSHPLLPTHYTVSIGLFSMSSYPLLPYKWAHQYCLSRFYIYALICNICFSLFLVTSL